MTESFPNFIELKYSYAQDSGKISINTVGFSKNMTEIKQVIIEQKDNLISKISLFPNGVIIYSEQHARSVLFKSNFPFKEVAPGKLELQLN